MRTVACAAVGAVLCLAGCGQPTSNAPATAETEAAQADAGLSPIPDDVPNQPPSKGAEGAEELVRDLNAARETPDGRVALDSYDSYFVYGLAGGLANNDREFGSVLDFDFRWRSQDPAITDVGYVTKLDSDDRAGVKVTYKDHGQPRETFYWVCRRPNGLWRVTEILWGPMPNQESARQMLRLPPLRGDSIC